MVWARVFLKIDISASKKFFQVIKNFLVFLDELEKKSRLNFVSSLDLLFGAWVFHIDCETPFSIDKTNDIIRCYLRHMHLSESFSCRSRATGYYDSADFLRCVCFIIHSYYNIKMKQRKISQGHLPFHSTHSDKPFQGVFPLLTTDPKVNAAFLCRTAF